MTDDAESDVFICHASEDKESVARPLYETLVRAGLKVWYDEFSLKLGDSLRQTIEKGVTSSRFAVVIFSTSFFKKKWPQDELDGLFALESGQLRILPVWHGVGEKYIRQRSPILAGRRAAQTKRGIDHVAEEILDVVDPGKGRKVRHGRAVTVWPTEIRLGAEQKLGTNQTWAVRTPVLISNPGDTPVYAVCVRMSVSGIEAKSVEIEPGKGVWHTALTGSVGPLTVSPEFSRVSGKSAETNEEVVLLYLHTMAPHSSREIVVSGAQVPASASISIASFESQPGEILQNAEGVLWPIHIPEGIIVNQIGYFVPPQTSE